MTMTSKRYVALVLCLVVLAWLLSTSLVIVKAGEAGVVTQFGRVTGKEMNPGLNAKLPYPFQGITIFDTRVQKEQSEVDAASADLQEVKSTIALNYHVDRSEVSNIYQTVGSEFADRLIAPAVQEAFKATTAQYSASDLLVKRAEVKDKARGQLIDRLQKYGVIIDDLSIVNFNFSVEFNKAIEQKQIAQQQAEQAQYHLEQAQKDAQAQAAQKDSLTPEILQKMAIDKWNGEMPQYVGSGSVFNIPLTK